MDQCRNNSVLLLDGEAADATGQDPASFGQLKQILPECFVSVKLEAYEDGSSERSLEAVPVPLQVPVQVPVAGILRAGCCNRPAIECSCCDPKSNCVVITPATSAPFTCQLVPSTMMSQQDDQSAHQQATPQQSAPRTVTTAAAELSWLPQTYTDPTITSQGTQFQPYQMQYVTADGTVLTQSTGERIMIKQNSNQSGRSDNTNVISTISGLGGAEGCDPNTFINYVLNQQRTGGGSSSIAFLSFEPSRPLSSHVVQQQHITTNREQVPREATHNATSKLERVVEGSPQTSTPADNSDTGSAADSPNPGEVVGNQVSRYCQTVPVTPQQQDAKIGTEDFEEVLGTSQGGFIIKQIKPIPFGHLRLAQPITPDHIHVDHASNDSENHVTCQNDDSNGDLLQQPEKRGGTGAGMTPGAGAQGRSKTGAESAGVKLGANISKPIANFTSVLSMDRAFRCEICGKAYPTQQALVNHDRYHRGDRPYECETCHKAFATNSHLVTHRRTHTGERPFQCQVCQRCFADRSAFMKHERTHGPNGSIIKRYKCEECGNGFVDSCGLKKHTRIHTGERPYICLVCHKAFSTSSTFVAHKRIHTGERPYKCESCEKMFVTKSHLLTHRRKHTGEKPFTCSVCNRCFADGSSFRRHERLHTGENRHVCEICGRGFPLQTSLDRHKQTHMQAGNFTYVTYENQQLQQQQQQPSPPQQQQQRVIAQSHCVVTDAIPVNSDVRIIGSKLTQDIQIRRGNGTETLCAVSTPTSAQACDIDMDSQRNRANNAVPNSELA